MNQLEQIEYYLWYGLLASLGVVVAITWIISFQVPPGQPEPVKWLIENKTVGFSFYIIFFTILFSLYLSTIFVSWYTIDLKEPLTFQGIFIFAVTILLLSSFFIDPDAYEEGRSKKFYDTHPLIFYTSVALLTLGLIACVVSIVKSHHNFVNHISTTI